MARSSQATQFPERMRWLRDLLIFFLFFLYVWLKIDPKLYFQQQGPDFFATFNFLREFLSYPGGLTDYLATIFSQLFYFPWLGALVITLIAGLVVLAINRMIRLTANELQKSLPDQINLLHLFPVILLIGVHNNYEHTLNLSLGYMLVLLATVLYLKVSVKKPVLRIIVYIVLSVILYYFAGGPFLLYAILCLLFELIVRGNLLVSVSIVIGSLLIPYLSSVFLFMVNLRQAFLYLLPFDLIYQPAFIPYLLYLYPPLVLIGMALRLRILSDDGILVYRLPLAGKLFQKYYRGKKRLATDALLLIGSGFLVAFLTFNAVFKTFLSLDYYAENKNWEQVLKIAKKHSPSNELATCLVNRALAHQGQLLNDMFSFPQYYGADGLFMSRDLRNAFPIIRSDILFDLGHINESEHWSQEAISLKGMRPRNLKRLALITLLKGEKNSCRKCLDILRESPLFRKWSDHYHQYLENDSLLANDPELSLIKGQMAQSDFIANIGAPDQDLENLLKQNPSNQLAFEYLMADYLLNGDLIKFIESFPKYYKTSYFEIPKHYNEAMLIYMTESKEGSLPLLGNLITIQSTIKRFKDFKRILSDYKGNKRYAQSQLQQEYGDTYWYYILYILRSSNE